jgi:hypothetical protein
MKMVMKSEEVFRLLSEKNNKTKNCLSAAETYICFIWVTVPLSVPHTMKRNPLNMT